MDTKFPWRFSRSAYRILVAEFLLVRTRAEVIAKIFPQLTEKYPNIQSLAVADESELFNILKSLGIPKRIPYFKRAAHYIVENHKGQIPKKPLPN